MDDTAADALIVRYKTACEFKQTVDRQRITIALKTWLAGLSAPTGVEIRFDLEPPPHCGS